MEEQRQTIPLIDTNGDLNLAHLQAHLARLDLCIQRELLRWQRAGRDPNDESLGIYLSDCDATDMATRPLGSNWGDMVALLPEEEAHFAWAIGLVGEEIQSIVQIANAQGQSLRLPALASTFELDPFELDVLVLSLAPSFDLRYEWLYGYLQDDVMTKLPNVNLVLNLLCPIYTDRFAHLAHFADDAPLLRHQLLQVRPTSDQLDPPLLRRSLLLDRTIGEWLLGRYRPNAQHLGFASLTWPTVNSTDELLCAESRILLQNVTLDSQTVPPLWILYGPDSVAQASAARLLAAQLEQPILAVDLAAVDSQQDALLQIIRLTLRDARLVGAIAYFQSFDLCLVDGSPPAAIFAELCVHPAPVVIAGRTQWRPQGIERSRWLFTFNFAAPTNLQRKALWLHFLEARATVDSLDVTELANHFTLTTGQIRDAVQSAHDVAGLRGEPLLKDDLFAAARAHSSPRLELLARKIKPRFGWQDLVLPADQTEILHELVATVRQGPFVLETWGIGEKLAASAGLTVLFAGPPGTGKTMAAEVIATELGLDLYKIDLSGVVSKYIGETEKNLERIFGEAASSNSILLFDEADALFGKRSEVRDAHDRYANIETSYLLQRMEAYDGVTILATNLWTNLDDAFTRRLHFVVDFPFPDDEDRLHIWQRLFPAKVPRSADVDLDLLARRFKLTGGNIRNILVNASYLAAANGRCITMEYLLHGTRRELQKMGRIVSEGEFRV